MLLDVLSRLSLFISNTICADFFCLKPAFSVYSPLHLCQIFVASSFRYSHRPLPDSFLVVAKQLQTHTLSQVCRRSQLLQVESASSKYQIKHLRSLLTHQSTQKPILASRNYSLQAVLWAPSRSHRRSHPLQ